jgi:DNA-binding NtrC family response regulator
MNSALEHSSTATAPSNDRGSSAPPKPGIAGRSPVFLRMLDWVGRVARSDLPVLVCGETGSGKEGVALTLHRQSRRRAGRFVAVNCTALSESLLDAELFGTVRGAYTGSDRDRPGLFRLAHGGTLFFDEVGDMPRAMQAKLLRVLQERCVRPVGGDEESPVDVRLVAATHHDLERDVLAGSFRADLFYRLAVAVVHVPPLRERLDDLDALVEILTPRLRRETGCGVVRLAACARRVLEAYPWPGNVRELHTVLARALLRANGEEIRAAHLAPLRPDVDHDRVELPLEIEMIDAALRDAGGSITDAARRIGWTRQKLYRRMKALSVRERGTRSSESSTFQ